MLKQVTIGRMGAVKGTLLVPFTAYHDFSYFSNMGFSRKAVLRLKFFPFLQTIGGCERRWYPFLQDSNCAVRSSMIGAPINNAHKEIGDVCFFEAKTSAACGTHLQASAAEEVDQTSTICNKKIVCFLTSADCPLENGLKHIIFGGLEIHSCLYSSLMKNWLEGDLDAPASSAEESRSRSASSATEIDE
ncbi:hypothetical protein LXL04_010526 [Taraxacum kok-saghyz]